MDRRVHVGQPHRGVGAALVSRRVPQLEAHAHQPDVPGDHHGDQCGLWGGGRGAVRVDGGDRVWAAALGGHAALAAAAGDGDGAGPHCPVHRPLPAAQLEVDVAATHGAPQRHPRGRDDRDAPPPHRLRVPRDLCTHWRDRDWGAGGVLRVLPHHDRLLHLLEPQQRGVAIGAGQGAELDCGDAQPPQVPPPPRGAVDGPQLWQRAQHLGPAFRDVCIWRHRRRGLRARHHRPGAERQHPVPNGAAVQPQRGLLL